MSANRPTPDWDSLTFQLTLTDVVYRCASGGANGSDWPEGEYLPFRDVSVSPAAASLSYGLGVFEGLKAERTEDGRVLLFRPDENGKRLARSAGILRIPAFPPARFVDVMKELIRRNARFVPPAGKGTLYLRPVLHACEPMLGLRACTRAEFLAYASPVGTYFKGNEGGVRLKALRLGRVAPGGTGSAKAMGNYPAGIRARMLAKTEGFDDVLYLDARHLRYATETSGSNVFALFPGNVLVTPPLDDQILPGITRASVIALAKEELGLKVEERPLDIEELLSGAVEVFCTGTAWTVRSVAELVLEGRSKKFPGGSAQSRLFELLRAVQSGKSEDARGWTVAVPV